MDRRIATLGEDAKTGRRLVASSDEKSAWAWIETAEGPSDRIEFSVENLSAAIIGLNFQASHGGCFFSALKDTESSVLVSFRLASEAAVSRERMGLADFEQRLDRLMPNRRRQQAGPF